jgi:hypothetical protein
MKIFGRLIVAGYLIVISLGAARLVITEDDGTQRVFIEQVAPSTQAAGSVEPLPTTAPAYQNNVRILPGEATAKLAALRPSTRVTFATGEHKTVKSWEIKVSDVLITGEPGAVIYDNDPDYLDSAGKKKSDGCKIGLSITGSARNVIVERLVFYSPDELTQRFISVQAQGKNIEVRHCLFERAYYGVLTAETPNGVFVHHSRGNDVGYFVYAKGRNITVEDSESPNAQHAFLRSNQCDGLTVRRCKIVGGAGITLQRVSNVLVEDIEISKAGIRTGPLNNKDGVRGDGGPAKFLQSLTSNVTIQRVKYIGTSSAQVLTVGNRSVGVTVNDITGSFRFEIPGATTVNYLAATGYPAGSVLSPKAVRVTRDGVVQ